MSDLYRENGLEPDLDSYTALLAMYGEAGDMESIMKVSSLSSHACTQSTLLYQHHNSLDLSVRHKKKAAVIKRLT